MHVGLAYPVERGTTGEHLERALRRAHTVTTIDLIGVTGWRVIAGYAVPTRIPPSFDALFPQGRPDMLIEVDGQGGRHLPRMRKLGIPTALWGIDSHRFFKRRFHMAILADFDYVFLAQKDDIPAYSAHHPNVLWCPLAADTQLHRDRGLQRDLDIVFVGSLDPTRHPDRLRLLERLARRFRVEAREDVWGEACGELMSRARIVFNRSVAGDLNMRVFEGMLAGAMVLTDAIGAGLGDLFEDRRHLVTYRERDLEELAHHYLTHEDERAAIARAGHDAVSLLHTYDERAERLVRPLAGRRPGARGLPGATVTAAPAGEPGAVTVPQDRGNPPGRDR